MDASIQNSHYSSVIGNISRLTQRFHPEGAQAKLSIPPWNEILSMTMRYNAHPRQDQGRGDAVLLRMKFFAWNRDDG